MACEMHPLITLRAALKRRYMHEMAGVQERFGLTAMEVDVILFLSANPDYPTASDMVHCCQLTKSHVSKAVEGLTARGCLRQERDPDNRRRVNLRLCEPALPVAQAGREAQQRFVDALTRGLTGSDVDELRRMLDTIARNAVAGD